MTNPERPSPLTGPEAAFIEIAHMFSGVNYPIDQQGLTEANADLVAQHEKVMPPQPKLSLLSIVAKKDPLIRTTEQMAALALDDNDYEAALFAINYLHKFGDIDRKNLFGGEAFDLSIQTHRALGKLIRDRFSSTDPYLRVSGDQVFANIEKLRQHGEIDRELEVLRGVIHIVALNGTLGEEAKQQFDPFALVELNN